MDGKLAAVAAQAGGRVDGHTLLGVGGKGPGNGQEHQDNESGKI